MRIESGKLPAGTDLAGVHLTGIVVGDAIVGQGGQTVVDGFVAGNLTVGRGCVAQVNGTITGDLTSYGTTEVAGVVNGNAFEHPGGQVRSSLGAAIGRGVIGPGE